MHHEQAPNEIPSHLGMCSNQKVRAVVIRTVARLHSLKKKFLELASSFSWIDIYFLD